LLLLALEWKMMEAVVMIWRVTLLVGSRLVLLVLWRAWRWEEMADLLCIIAHDVLSYGYTGCTWLRNAAVAWQRCKRVELRWK
jgi:hypothetical protein